MLEPEFSILFVFNFVTFVSYSCVSIFLPFCGLLEQFLEFKQFFNSISECIFGHSVLSCCSIVHIFLQGHGRPCLEWV